MYLGWYDPEKTKSGVVKLAEAAARYRQKFAEEPLVALVNQVDAGVELAGVEVRVSPTVAPNTFYVGRDEAPHAED